MWFGMATLQSRCQLRLARFLKHASSEVHIQSVVALTGCDTCRSQLNDCVDARSAPSASDMRAVWNRRREGDASFHVIPGFGGQRKRQQCEFCIAEAVRMQQRAHLQLSVVMATHVDGKGTRLTVRYSATTADLDTQKGQLGHVQHAGAHPDSVAAYKQSIHSIMKNFCTLGFGAPPRSDGCAPPKLYDEKLFCHLAKIHELFDSDAARTMILTAMELSNHDGTTPDSFLPANKYMVKDPTHAARRRHAPENRTPF